MPSPLDERATAAIGAVRDSANQTHQTLINQLPDVIRDDDEYARVGDLVTQANEADRRIGDWFAPMRTSAHRTWKTLCDHEKDTRAPLATFVATGRARLNAYVKMRTEQRAREAAEAAAALAALPSMLSEFAIAPAPASAPVAPGTSTRDVEVLTVDVFALCRWIVDVGRTDGCVDINMPAVREVVRQARSVGDPLPDWITVRTESQVVLRRRS